MYVKKLLKSNAEVLLHLKKCKPNIRNYIVKNADKELIECLSKITSSILQNHVKLNSKQKTQIKKYRPQVNQLLGGKKNLKNKKKALQTVGFLSAIIGPIAAILTSIIGGAIGK